MKQLRAPAAHAKLATGKPTPQAPPPLPHNAPLSASPSPAPLPVAAATHGLPPGLPSYSPSEASQNVSAGGGRATVQLTFSDKRKGIQAASRGQERSAARSSSLARHDPNQPGTQLADAQPFDFSPRQQLDGAESSSGVSGGAEGNLNKQFVGRDADILCLERAGGLTRAYRVGDAKRSRGKGRGESFAVRCFDNKQGAMAVSGWHAMIKKEICTVE